MTEANVLALRFDESGHAYQALGKLREAESRGLLTINQAVVIRRSLDGSLSAPDDDYLNGEGLLTGTMIGGLVGLLGGPIGLLLGFGAGAAIGGAWEATRVETRDSLLAEYSRTIAPGDTVLFADVVEVTPMIVDTVVTDLSGVVLRRPTAQVLAEVEAAEDAADAAADEAERVLREQRRADRREALEDRLAQFTANAAARRADLLRRRDNRGSDFPEDESAADQPDTEWRSEDLATAAIYR